MVYYILLKEIKKYSYELFKIVTFQYSNNKIFINVLPMRLKYSTNFSSIIYQFGVSSLLVSKVS